MIYRIVEVLPAKGGYRSVLCTDDEERMKERRKELAEGRMTEIEVRTGSKGSMTVFVCHVPLERSEPPPEIRPDRAKGAYKMLAEAKEKERKVRDRKRTEARVKAQSSRLLERSPYVAPPVRMMYVKHRPTAGMSDREQTEERMRRKAETMRMMETKYGE